MRYIVFLLCAPIAGPLFILALIGALAMWLLEAMIRGIRIVERLAGGWR